MSPAGEYDIKPKDGLQKNELEKLGLAWKNQDVTRSGTFYEDTFLTL